jgi:hypothetical protein
LAVKLKAHANAIVQGFYGEDNVSDLEATAASSMMAYSRRPRPRRAVAEGDFGGCGLRPMEAELSRAVAFGRAAARDRGGRRRGAEA